MSILEGENKKMNERQHIDFSILEEAINLQTEQLKRIANILEALYYKKYRNDDEI